MPGRARRSRPTSASSSIRSRSPSSPSWNPTRTGSSLKLSAQEKETIRTGVAKLVEEEFAREIQAGGRYPVVTETAPDVLRVRAGIVNLYINAPDTGPGRSRTIVSSAGEMTLIAELTDSASGQVLARVADRQRGDQHPDAAHQQHGQRVGGALDRRRLGEDPAQGAGQRARAGREVGRHDHSAPRVAYTVSSQRAERRTAPLMIPTIE